MSASPEDFRRLLRFYAQHGVAHLLPTTVTASVDLTLRSLEALADAVEASPRSGEAAPIGVHLEGPFLSHDKRGVHPAAELQLPSATLFDRFQQAARGHILLLTLAPELPGATELIAHATSKGVRVSLGHTNAVAAEALAAIAAGAASATHIFNAMRAFDHREPGILGTVLDTANLYAELICDGVHVAPAAVRLWQRSKAPDHAMLVSDSMAATGMPDGAYTLGGLPATVRGGRALLTADLSRGAETLAGSLLTLDRAVSNCRLFTGCSLADAVRYASHNPARLLGRPELTRLAPGSPANLNRFNAEGQLIATYLNGREVRRQTFRDE